MNWKLWINSYDKDIKFFIIYILLTPLFNLGWNLKVPGIGLSLTAVFSSIFILYSTIYLLKSSNPAFPKRPITKFINFFCFLIIIDFFVTILITREIYVLDQSLKGLYLVLFYYIFRRIIRSEIDFLMLIQTYFYSYLIIILNFYLSFFGLSRIRASRGFERLTLGYYDVTNIAIQSIFVLILSFFFYTYFYKRKTSFKNSVYPYIIFFSFNGILIVQRTYHIISYVCIGMLLFFVLINIKNRLFNLFLISPFIVAIVAYSIDAIYKFYNIIYWDFVRLFNDGGSIPVGFLHGRVSLWLKFYDQYINLNFFQKFTGWYFTAYASSYAHNDFLRIFAGYGVLGLTVYLIVLLLLFSELFKTKVDHLKKTGFCIFFTTILYSLTTCPTEYTFSIIPIFSFIVYLIKFNYDFRFKI